MKSLSIIMIAVSLLFMAATPPFKKEIIGVWKIQSMELKGAKMVHQQLGTPFIEFNDEGGFMLKLSTSSEKGRYRLKDSTLTLKFLYPRKPTQRMVINKLNDTEMDYTTADSNGMKVKCYRITLGIGDEKD